MNCVSCGKDYYPIPYDKSDTDRQRKLRAYAMAVWMHCSFYCLNEKFQKEAAEERTVEFEKEKMELVKLESARLKTEKFYYSREWLDLRFQVLRKIRHCQNCGKGREDGIKLHVDHVKPISKHPLLALDKKNLQVLCEACNLGKSNRHETDFRESDGLSQIGIYKPPV